MHEQASKLGRFMIDRISSKPSIVFNFPNFQIREKRSNDNNWNSFPPKQSAYYFWIDHQRKLQTGAVVKISSYKKMYESTLSFCMRTYSIKNQFCGKIELHFAAGKNNLQEVERLISLLRAKQFRNWMFS